MVCFLLRSLPKSMWRQMHDSPSHCVKKWKKSIRFASVNWSAFLWKSENKESWNARFAIWSAVSKGGGRTPKKAFWLLKRWQAQFCLQKLIGYPNKEDLNKTKEAANQLATFTTTIAITGLTTKMNASAQSVKINVKGFPQKDPILTVTFVKPDILARSRCSAFFYF